MPKKIIISKSFIKQLVTILNKYIDNPHLICGYTKFPEHINVVIQVWDLDNQTLGKFIGICHYDVNPTLNIKNFEERVSKEVNKYLNRLSHVK